MTMQVIEYCSHNNGSQAKHFIVNKKNCDMHFNAINVKLNF